MRWIVLLMGVIAAALTVVGIFAPRHPLPASQPVVALPEPAAFARAPDRGPSSSERCDDAPAFVSAAARNAEDIDGLDFSPFNRPETGWRIYAPQVAAEIGSTCAFDSPGFANALAGWQGANRLPTTGVMDPATFQAMKVRWHLKRPFVILNRTIGCPPAPPASALAYVRPEEMYGSDIQVRADALAAYRRMVADARAADPAIAADPQALRIFSGYRSPESEDAKCLTLGGCDNVTRAPCSAHRAGIAFDLVVGSAPGGRVDSTEDANRLAMTRTPAYRWMVRNAHRYGFVNYVFEPWHWEWSPPEQRGATRA